MLCIQGNLTFAGNNVVYWVQRAPFSCPYLQMTRAYSYQKQISISCEGFYIAGLKCHIPSILLLYIGVDSGLKKELNKSLADRCSL